jgi:SAM-dependent methyltransferase
MKPCRGCGAPLTTTFLDLGDMPLANAYPRTAAEAEAEPRFSLHAFVCDRCLLVQLAHEVLPEEIFTDYAYFSSYSDSWVAHARRFAEEAIGRFGLDPASQVVEIASNDGYLLQHFRDRGIPVLGVEPAANVAVVAEAAGIPTDVAFFGADTAARLIAAGTRADLLVGNNVTAHVPDLHDFVEGMQVVLAPEGVISLEFPHLLRFIEGVQFDTIYHEHFSYLSLVALEPVLAAHGLRVFAVDELPTHGGSLRLYACHVASARPEEPSAERVRAAERASGLHELDTYLSFAPLVERCRDSLQEFLTGARATGETVVAYGAAAKGVTFLNYCGVTTEQIAYVVDRSDEKQGRFLPGVHLPIHAPAEVFRTKPDVVLILPWNLRDEIVAQMADVRSWGGRFVIAVPEVREVP